jgi:hypothetical protein
MLAVHVHRHRIDPAGTAEERRMEKSGFTSQRCHDHDDEGCHGDIGSLRVTPARHPTDIRHGPLAINAFVPDEDVFLLVLDPPEEGLEGGKKSYAETTARV